MSLPKVLKGFNVRVDGEGWLGETESIELPKLTRKTEEWRGGGMDGAIDIDMGQDKLEATVSCGGLMEAAFKHYGDLSVSKVPLMFYGSYEGDEGTSAVEVEMRGRWTEIDMGSAKAGDKTEHKFKASLSYYKLVIDGTTKIEIDLVNLVFNVEGVDRLEARRRALQLS